MKLSVIIPSYKDPLLHKTIQSLLDGSALGDDLEIIPVIDGYTLESPIIEDKRVRPVFHSENLGMRSAINTGVKNARGELIMRTDEHCLFCPNYDLILTGYIERNWIVTPRRYFLDTEKWEVMNLPYVDYEKLLVAKYERGKKFSGFAWDRPDREDIAIDETFAMQGSCWIMHKEWWDSVIGELQNEGYDTHYQDSHEMSFKTWKAGGKLMVNKLAWFAHKHRSFNRTHRYGGERMDRCFEYALSVWRDYFESEIKPRQEALMQK